MLAMKSGLYLVDSSGGDNQKNDIILGRSCIGSINKLEGAKCNQYGLSKGNSNCPSFPLILVFFYP